MTLRRITPAQARLLRLAVDVDIPRRMESWHARLDAGVLTDEMRDVLEAFGYLDREDKRQRKPTIVSEWDHLLWDGEHCHVGCQAAPPHNWTPDSPPLEKRVDAIS